MVGKFLRSQEDELPLLSDRFMVSIYNKQRPLHLPFYAYAILWCC